MPEPLLGAAAIERYLGELAAELTDRGPKRTVIVVGGALLAWHGLRDATRDVDSATRIDSELAEAVARVAERHGLAPRWLNDAAAALRPRDLRTSRVRSPLREPDASSARGAVRPGVPHEALRVARRGYRRPRGALAALLVPVARGRYDGYPLEDHDEFLADHIRGIVDTR